MGVKISLIVTVVVVVTACGFRGLRRDLSTLENVGTLEVEVSAEEWDGSPLVVAALVEPSSESATVNVARFFILPEPRSLEMRLVPGTYILVAFEDSNRNGEPDDGERGSISESVVMHRRSNVRGLELEVSEELIREPNVANRRVVDTSYYSWGEVVSLDEERFGPEAAQMGLWQPIEFLQRHHPGVFMLEPYDPERTPVIFVHGMTGHPREFSHIIDGLDRTRFQPWFLLYPSGASLPDVADVFAQIVVALELQHSFERHCVVAHSMGGLVSRAYVDELYEQSSTPTVRGLVTIATPLGGMPSASWGVRFAPTVVPAWHDISPGSDFLESLFSNPLPEGFEYHLLFTWQGDGSSDGTVTLPSSLRDDAQAQATFIRGFEAPHGGCLRSDEVRDQVYVALDRCLTAGEPITVNTDGCPEDSEPVEGSQNEADPAASNPQ